MSIKQHGTNCKFAPAGGNDPNYNSKGTGKDLIGHSQITDGNGNTMVDWGPAPEYGVDGFGDVVPGTNSYEHGFPISSDKMKWDPISIDGANTGRISNWNPTGDYNLCFNSCVSQTSRALNASGVINVGIHPYLLHAQMYLRFVVGARPLLYSYYLTR